MRTLTALLMLVVSASQLKAQDLAGEFTLNRLGLTSEGARGLVQEYDGRRYGAFDSGWADFNTSASGKNSYLDLSASGLGGGEESGYLSLTVGPLGISGYLNTLTHRQPFINTGMSTLTDPFVFNTTLLPWNALWNTKLDPLLAGFSDLAFKRTESEFKAVYAVPDSNKRLFAKVWKEDEQGTMAAKMSSKIGAGNVDRQTENLTIGADAAVGSRGAVAYDYTQGAFNDDAAMVTVSTTSSFFYLKAPGPRQRTDLHNVSFRYGNVTASANSRTRENSDNGYKSGAYTATLAASRRFGKKLSVTVKTYGHTEQFEENDAFRFMSKYTNAVAGTPKAGETSQIDRANFLGEMQVRYNLSDKTGINLGYKVDHNYRRHTAAEVYTSTDPYQDGVFFAAGTQYNATAEKNTQNIFTAGINASLPFDAELGLGYKAMRANAAVFESMPTTSNEYTADLYVPLKANISLLASALAQSEKNEKSHHTYTSSYQNSYMGGLEWSGSGRFTAGADYSYDQVSNHGDVYMGGFPRSSRDTTSGAYIRLPGALYRYENNVVSFHATARLNKQFTLAGNTSYTRSQGTTPVNIVLVDGTITDLEPQEIRIIRTGLNLKYKPASHENMSANFGLRRDQWTDKMDWRNKGWINVAELSVSAKF